MAAVRQPVDPLLGGTGLVDVETLASERPRDELAQVDFIVDDEHPGSIYDHAPTPLLHAPTRTAGNTISKVVPISGSLITRISPPWARTM